MNGLSEAEELELLELEEQEYQSGLAANPEKQGMPGQGSSMLAEVAKPVLKGLDYAGGLVRTGVGEVADVFVQGNKVTEDDWEQALKGNAPGSAELMERYGVPEGARVNLFPEVKVPGTDITLGEGDSSLRDIGGFALDVATDPLTYGTLGLAAAAKAPLKRGLKKAGQALKSGAKATGETSGNLLSKTGEALTAAPRRDIEVYAARTEKLNKDFKKYDGDTAVFADDIKQAMNKKIQDTKAGLNRSIDDSLATMPESKSIDISWATNKLDDQKSKLNSALHKDAIKEIDELKATIDDLALDGKISVKDLNEFKKYMQGQAKTAYPKNGQIFTRSKESAKAAKDVARLARKQLNEFSPEIAKANNSLSRLHSLEDSMNRNLIKEGSSFNALKTAGSGANKRNRKQLAELGEITGEDFVGKAEDLSAFDTFANPSVLPMDTTGKSVARTGVAYMLGGPVGAVLTSPLTLKAMINAGRVPKAIIKKFGGGSGGSGKQIDRVFNNIRSKSGQRYLGQISNAARIAAVHANRKSSGAVSGTGSDSERSYYADLKGKDKWAFDGYLNLVDGKQSSLLEDEKVLEKLFSKPKGKQLLIAASSIRSKSSKEKILKKIKQFSEAK